MFLRPRPGEFKHKFTRIEDFQLREVVRQVGTKDWSLVAIQMSPRTARQCRERWNNYINPVIDKMDWTAEEDRLLDAKFAELGSKWKLIAAFFPTRSKNMVKYRYQRKRRVHADGPATDGAANNPAPIPDRGSIWAATAFESSIDPTLWDDFTLGFV
jgi:hypothetical protein